MICLKKLDYHPERYQNVVQKQATIFALVIQRNTKTKRGLKKTKKKRKRKIKEGKTNGNYLMMKTWTSERIPILKWLANDVEKKKKEKRYSLFMLVHF